MNHISNMQHINITVPVEALNLSLYALSNLAESARRASGVLQAAGARALDAQQAAMRARESTQTQAPIVDSEGGEH